jgi:predicted amidophosphoribosyltransferase
MKGVNLEVECEKCGKPINTGRFCEDCSDKLRSNLESANSSKKKKEKSKRDAMFIKNRLGKR